MIKHGFVIALFGLLFPMHSQAQQCPEISADTDSSRIIVAGGSITEIIYDLGAGDKIVAADSTSNYPAAARELPQIGYVRALSAEGVLSQEPTLLLGEDDTGPPEILDQLRAAGLPIAILGEQHDSQGIIDKVRCVGDLIGMPEAAEAYIAERLKPAADTLLAVQSSDKPSGAILLGIRDGTLIAAGTETSGDGLLEMMSASNALEQMSGWKPVSREAMIVADPSFLVIPQRGLDAAGGVEGLLEHPTLKFTSAAKNGRVFAMDGMAMLGFGPRTLNAAAQLADDIRAEEGTASE
ncbi:MAG: ABC transporter substrate-binding protein [Pseudomonadota bacterium]